MMPHDWQELAVIMAVAVAIAVVARFLWRGGR